VEEEEGDERGKSSVYGHVTRGIAKRVEEKSSTCLMTKSTEALWRGHS